MVKLNSKKRSKVKTNIRKIKITKPKSMKNSSIKKISVKSKGIKGFDKGTGIILVAFFILLLGFALIFSAKYLFSSDKANTYNGFVVKKGTDNLWHLNSQQGDAEVDVPFHYNPKELEDVEIQGNPNWFFKLLDKYGLNAAYITFNPAGQAENSFKYTALAASELSLSLTQAFNVKPIAACVAKSEGVCEDRPIADCSSNDRMVIYLQENPINRTLITEDTNCIVVEGQGEELVKATEKLLYYWYGVYS